MRGGLFTHALGVALTASEIYRYRNRGQRGIAFTAGLLHDIGKVVLDTYFVDIFPLFYQHIHDPTYDFVTLEKETLGIDHQEAGSTLAEHWRLPEYLQHITAFHHSPDRQPVHRELTHTVCLADLLVTQYLAGHEKERPDAGGLAANLDELGLQPSDLVAIIGGIPWATLQSGTWLSG